MRVIHGRDARATLALSYGQSVTHSAPQFTNRKVRIEKLKRLIILAFPLAVVLACSSFGTKWETVSEGGITVEMPGKPTKQSQDIPTPAGKATGQMLTLDKGAEADPIMIDFWLVNGKLQSDGGGEYRVRYTIDGGAPRFIDVWNPIWISGWTSGKHTIKLELVDNGGYNSTTREINVTP